LIAVSFACPSIITQFALYIKAETSKSRG
jgi:hypothetical protein